MVRFASVLLIALLVGGAGYAYGVVGALLALPIAILISFATETLIARVQPSQSARARRKPPGS
jgi:predicted PurR-regulated permease PerM